MKLAKIKSIRYVGRGKAWNISMKNNKNFILSNGILTHNTKLAQDALRNIMETYSRNAFFILTCNTISKIIDPIKSRCIVIQFANPDKVEIVSYLRYICKNENMIFTEEGLNMLVNKMYPSIRNCVVFLQDLYTLRKLVVSENIVTTNDIYEIIYSHLKARNIEEMKKILFEKEIDLEEFNSFLWYKGVETNNIKLIITTGKNEKDFRLGCDNKIVFLTSIYELLASIK